MTIYEVVKISFATSYKIKSFLHVIIIITVENLKDALCGPLHVTYGCSFQSVVSDRKTLKSRKQNMKSWLNDADSQLICARLAWKISITSLSLTQFCVCRHICIHGVISMPALKYISDFFPLFKIANDHLNTADPPKSWLSNLYIQKAAYLLYLRYGTRCPLFFFLETVTCYEASENMIVFLMYSAILLLNASTYL